MVLVVHGFPSKVRTSSHCLAKHHVVRCQCVTIPPPKHAGALQVQALQFEWAWQNPLTSRAAREMAIRLGFNDKTFSVPNKARRSL